MNNQSEVIRNDKSFVLNALSWLVGLLFFAIGVINMFWGNDFFFGVFLAGLSLVFLPAVNVFARDKFGFSIPLVAKNYYSPFYYLVGSRCWRIVR